MGKSSTFDWVFIIALLALPLACLVAVFSFPLLTLYNQSAPPSAVGQKDAAIVFNAAHLQFDAILAVAIIAYLVAVYLMPAAPAPRLRWLIIATPIVAALIMLFFYPITSTDIYDLIFRAHITNRGGNPLTDIPFDYRYYPDGSKDALYAIVAWFNDPSPYGPAWEGLAALSNKLAGTNLLANLFAFKLVALASLAACAGLGVAIARRLGVAPLRAYYILAASPLALFDAIGNGHNDLTLVAFLLLGYLLLLRGWLWAALPALAVAVLIKFVPLLLVLLVIAYGIRRLGWREGGRQVVTGGIISLALAVAAYLPFWKGWQSIAPLHRTTLFTNSVAAALVNFTTPGAGRDLARTVALLLIGALTLGLVIWYARRQWLTGAATQDDALMENSGDLLLYFAAFGLAWWQPWYFLWTLPFIALRPSAGRLLILAAIHIVAFIYYALNTLEKVKIAQGDHENWVGFVVFIPLLAVMAWRTLVRTKDREL